MADKNQDYKEDYELCMKEYVNLKMYLIEHHKAIIKEYDDYRLAKELGFIKR